MADPVDVTYTLMEELKRDMSFLDPAIMCMRVTLPGKGVPAGWRLRMSKRELGDVLSKAYRAWPGSVTLTFEAPPETDELEGLSPRSADGVRLANSCYEGDIETVHALLAEGVDPDICVRTKGHNSPLNLAARGGHVGIMQVLLDRRVDPNSRNDFKETPLLCAANRARGSVCRLLLHWRADVHAVDENGDNALDFLGPGNSERKRHCREILQTAGAVWAGVEFPEGYNPHVQAMRLTMDPIPSEHRPMFYYIVTALALPVVTYYNLESLGFRKHKSGTLQYWLRRGRGKSAEPPIVFCHGVGVNLLPYEHFITELLRQVPKGKTIFLVSLPHISMRINEDVPSSAEMVACLRDMLASWEFDSAHFVGHSFGSIVVAWMCKNSKETVKVATFLDPVCFLLIKPDVCYNFMYRRPETPTQLLMHYFVARELFIAHSLSRNFFWYQNLLWPEELVMPTLVMLSGEDSIVPAHSVRRYLTGWLQQQSTDALRLLWFPNLGHGEMNFGPVGLAAVKRIVAEMMALEAKLQVGRRRGETFVELPSGQAPRNGAMQEPLSPTSNLICQSLQCSPPIAVVHEPNLRRPSSKASSGFDPLNKGHGATLLTHGSIARAAADMVLRPLSSGDIKPSRRGSKDVAGGYCDEQEEPMDRSSVRLLSEDEMAERRSSALSYFRETREINQHARSVEQMEVALARARRRRHSEELQPKQILALQELQEASDEAPEVEDHEVHELKTLAERMGYGVKPNQPSKWKKRAQEEKPRKPGGFASIQAGGNDLLARLRQRRVTIE
ncbi:ANKRD54 [Symbiodinium sp. KB8]|nr:ANKRD54 [Symbiodinium sp. KB8]